MSLFKIGINLYISISNPTGKIDARSAAIVLVKINNVCLNLSNETVVSMCKSLSRIKSRFSGHFLWKLRQQNAERNVGSGSLVLDLPDWCLFVLHVVQESDFLMPV